MSQNPVSILFLSDDPGLTMSFENALGTSPDLTITSREETLSSLNGSAVNVAGAHDIVVFETDPNDLEDVDALRRVAQTRHPGSKMIALTSGDVPLSMARALSRAGADEVIPREQLLEDIQPQIESWKRHSANNGLATSSDESQTGKIITVAGARGGIGKSTLAVNLADALQQKSGFRKNAPKASVLILDFDLQFGSVACLLDLDESDAFFEMMLQGVIPDKNYLSASIAKADCGLSALPAPSHFAPLNALSEEQVTALIANLRSAFDYIVVDLPQSVAPWMEAIFAATDKVLLVSDVSVPSMRTSRKLIDFIKQDQPALDIELVVNFEKKPMFAGQHHRQAMKFLETEFKHWIPPDHKSAKAASDRGKTVLELAPRSPLAKSVAALGKSVLKDLREVETATRPARFVSARAAFAKTAQE